MKTSMSVSTPSTWKREKVLCLAFKSCVPNPSLSVPTLPSHTQLFLDSVSFSPDKIENLLSHLDSDSATSSDSISPHVLKTCSAALAHPLSVLFTLSLAQGHLPSAYSVWSTRPFFVTVTNHTRKKKFWNVLVGIHFNKLPIWTCYRHNWISKCQNLLSKL